MSKGWASARPFAQEGYVWTISNHPKTPRLPELPILFKPAFKFILHGQVVCLMKFPRQRIRSHTEKFANTVANTRESGA